MIVKPEDLVKGSEYYTDTGQPVQYAFSTNEANVHHVHYQYEYEHYEQGFGTSTEMGWTYDTVRYAGYLFDEPPIMKFDKRIVELNSTIENLIKIKSRIVAENTSIDNEYKVLKETLGKFGNLKAIVDLMDSKVTHWLVMNESYDKVYTKLLICEDSEFSKKCKEVADVDGYNSRGKAVLQMNVEIPRYSTNKIETNFTTSGFNYSERSECIPFVSLDNAKEHLQAMVDAAIKIKSNKFISVLTTLDEYGIVYPVEWKTAYLNKTLQNYERMVKDTGYGSVEAKQRELDSAIKHREHNMAQIKTLKEQIKEIETNG